MAQQDQKATAPDNEGAAFLVRRGRALVCPVYKGIYERHIGEARGAARAWEPSSRPWND